MPPRSAMILGLLLSLPAWGQGTAEDWQSLATALNAPGSEVEVSCTRIEADRCAYHPLSTFLAALEAASPESCQPPVRVAVLGNSLIAADGVVSVVRQRLVERFGDGGRGFVLADRLGSSGPRDRTGLASGRWELSTVGMLKPLALPHGLSGAQHRVRARGASTQYTLRGETRAEVLWFSPKGRPGMRIEVDGVLLSSVYPAAPGAMVRTEVTLPQTTSTLKLVFNDVGPVVQGVVLERAEGGVVVDTFGVPSVDASMFLRTDEPLFVEQLHNRAPALVMVMLGGNEIKRLAWGKAELLGIEKDLRALLRRTRLAAPDASCLVISPIDSVRGGRSRFEPRSELVPYIQMQRQAAFDEQCAYFSLYDAMGGVGSLQRFSARGFVHADFVHPRGRGLDMLGELLASALLRAYDGREQLGRARTAAK